jgi:hypothetical protein
LHGYSRRIASLAAREALSPSPFKSPSTHIPTHDIMENLSIADAPPPPHGGKPQQPPQGRGGPPQPPAQLPPQMFTTAAQLLDLTDKKLMIALRDGRKLIGVLRSWDQFGA